MRLIITFIAAIAACAAFSSPALALAQAELQEIDDHLGRLMKNVNVVKRVKHKSGEVVSCVDIDRQPSMNHPSWRGGTVPRELSPPGKAMFPGVIVPAPPSELCPDGSVEMVLPTRDRIVFAGGLRNFLSKYPDGSGGVPPQAQESPAKGHVAAAKQAEAVVQYSPAPLRTLEVRPLRPSSFLKVEFLLFGYDKVEMQLPNGVGPEHQGSYVFAVPQSFATASYVCGAGKYISEVRITLASGAQVAHVFEICPDQQLTTNVRNV
jgi:hypothetical protein